MNKESISSLSFIIELLNPPMKHLVDDTQKLFRDLKHTYSNYNRLADNITELSHLDKTSQEVKILRVMNDKIAILNNFTSTNLVGFWETAEDVIKKTVNVLNIPLFFFRQYTIRFKASPAKEKDSRIFLCKNVCGLQDDKLKPFGRPLHGFGIRFVFPPISGAQTEQNEYNIRIESLLKEVGKIFMENQSRFLAPLQLQGDYIITIKEEIDKTHNFLKDNISTFLGQYNLS